MANRDWDFGGLSGRTGKLTEENWKGRARRDFQQAYNELLGRVLTEGEPHADRTGVGTTSLFGAQLVVDMLDGFPLLTTRRLPARWIFTELMWMLAGSTDEHELAARGVHTWGPWATAEKCATRDREAGDLGPTYGFLLRHFGLPYLDTATRRGVERAGRLRGHDVQLGHDQLWELCYNLDTQPFSRRHVVSHWDPVTVHTLEVPPCHPLFQVKVHPAPEEGLPEGMSLQVYQRSADAFVGLAFDVAHFAFLLLMLAEYTCRAPRRLVFSIGDLHVYNNHRDQVRELLGRTPMPLPTVTLTKERYHAQPGGPGQDLFVNLLQTKWEHVTIEGYDPHPPIAVDVAV